MGINELAENYAGSKMELHPYFNFAAKKAEELFESNVAKG